MTLEELKSKKIAIAGMGVNNKHLAGYFTGRGIKFEVIDNWQNPSELIGKLDNFEVTFRTPGLPFLSPAIQQARQKGVQIYSQTKLFFDLCPCPIIGVTGTKGKGTTATLIFKILEAAGKKAALAGNIGQDPFEFIDKIKPEDLVVLELSSFQLQDLHKSPHIAVVLKITPDHLDHHKTLAEYIDAKRAIVQFQGGADFAVLNYDSEVTRDFAKAARAAVVWNSTIQEVKPGCFVKDEKIFLDLSRSSDHPPQAWGGVGGGVEIMRTDEVSLVGKFNLENITAAIAACAVAGVTDQNIIRQAASRFQGLPHRLELAAEIKGVKFYDDSFSTTPETAMAAITAFAGPIILIAGGSEKNSDYSALLQQIAKSPVKALLAIGKTGPKIAKLAREAGFAGRILEENLDNMEKIVASANALSKPGDVVLLSPASASFDMFADYKHRGELFKKFVNKLATP